jgi:DNA invertase Pin-like site-specific DNA recombinase
MSEYFNNSQLTESKGVGIYTRYSSDLQRPSSSEDQIHECRDAAELKGWTVQDKYIRSDEAKTGQLLLGRHGLDDLMKLAQRSPRLFDGIVMDDTSRFGRNLSDTLKLTDTLKYAGVFLYFVNRQLDSRDPNFRTLYIQYGLQDEQASLVAGQKTHRGQRGCVLKGYMGSGRAYAYQNVPILSTTRKWQHGRPAIDGVEGKVNPEEAAVVVRIFDMYARGLGHRAIARALNEEGVPSPLQGKSLKRRVWTADNVKGILKNEKYRGVNVWNKTQIVRNPNTQRKEQHPRPESEWERVEVPLWRIVTDEQWNAAVKENRRRQGPSWWKEGGLNRTEAGRQYIFSGLMTCSGCHANINMVGGKVSSMRYGCIGHRYRGTCANNLTILRRLLEPQLLQGLSQSFRDSTVRERLYRNYHERIMAAVNEKASSLQRVESSAEDLQEKKNELKRGANNVMDMIQDGKGNSFLSDRLNSIHTEIGDIDAMLATLTEAVIEPLTEEAIRELVDPKLADLEAVLTGDPEIAKQRIRKHIAKLALTPVDTDKGPTYEVTGDVSVFACDDADDVLLDGSFQRTIKQYTSLSFPFRTTLYPRAEVRRNRSGMDGRYMTLD